MGFCAYNADPDSQTGGIIYIGVLPEHQSKGYGHKLFEAVKQDMENKGFRAIISKVKQGNDQAIKWHEKMGFSALEKGQAEDSFEEPQRVYAEGFGDMLMKFSLAKKDQTIIDLDSYGFSDEYDVRQMVEMSKSKQSTLSAFTTMMKEELGKYTRRAKFFNDDQLYRFARFYVAALMASGDEKKFKIEKVAAYLKGKTHLDEQEKISVQLLIEICDLLFEQFNLNLARESLQEVEEVSQEIPL